MKELKEDVLKFVNDNKRVRDAIADLFEDEDRTRLSDLTVFRWIKHNDPRLTCISVLEIIATRIDKPIEELTADTKGTTETGELFS